MSLTLWLAIVTSLCKALSGLFYYFSLSSPATTIASLMAPAQAPSLVYCGFKCVCVCVFLKNKQCSLMKVLLMCISGLVYKSESTLNLFTDDYALKLVSRYYVYIPFSPVAVSLLQSLSYLLKMSIYTVSTLRHRPADLCTLYSESCPFLGLSLSDLN